MKQHLLRITGLAILALFIQTSGFAQDIIQDNKDDEAPRRYDEIVIQHKGGKDAKVTIEIKDGDVLVNGKPVSEYDDSTLTIHRRKVVSRNSNNYSYGNGFSYSSPDMVAPGTGVQVFPNGSSGVWNLDNNRMGTVSRAQLGVLSENREDGKGVRITGVTKASAAEKIGLKIGDVITKIDDEEISSPRSLSSVIGDHKPGDKVTVTFTRDGKEQKQTATLGKTKQITVEPFNSYKLEMPEMPEMPEIAQGNWPREFRQYFGNSLKFGIRAQDGEEGKGAKVLNIDDESTASKAGIKEGDLITRFDGKEINSVTALTEAARAAKDKMTVKVTIIRDGKTQELDVKVPRRLRTADL
jgi:serine protease Do